MIIHCEIKIQVQKYNINVLINGFDDPVFKRSIEQYKHNIAGA